MKDDEKDHKLFLRLRGIPFSATEKEIREFLTGSNVCNIHFINNSDGRPAGECYCEFKTEEDTVKAREKDQETMGKRYIEVFKVGEVELITILKRLKDQSRLTGNNGFVRIRGLPFSCKKNEIDNFFKDLNVEEVVFGKEPGERGRPTGEAYIRFGSKLEAEKALRLNGQHIGHRYLEIYNADENGFQLFKKHVNGLTDRDLYRGSYGPSPYGPPSLGRYLDVGFPPFSDYDQDAYGGRPLYGGGGGGNSGGRIFHRDGFSRNVSLGGPRSRQSYRFNPYDYHGRGPPMSNSDAYDYKGGYASEGRGYADSNAYGNAGGLYGGTLPEYGGRYDGGDVYSLRAAQSSDAYDPYYYGAANPQEDLSSLRVYMRGIPFRITGKQIEEFFAPLRCVDVRVGFFEDGRSTGDGFVEFASRADAQDALKRDHETMGSRYIELFSQRELNTSKSLKIPHDAFYKTIGGRNLSTNNYQWL